jgi:predicted ATPase with chaperone activity
MDFDRQGVLFLDELPEFNRRTLEVMRQPLEDRQVTISRALRSTTFPADFMLIAALNPCPCGFLQFPSLPQLHPSMNPWGQTRNSERSFVRCRPCSFFA